MRGWKSWAIPLVFAAVAISAGMTALAFGGDLDDYNGARACASGQHSASVTCRETLSTTVATLTQASPCVATFAQTSVKANLTCESWARLASGQAVTLELWHGEIVTIAADGETVQTDAYPQDEAGSFLTIAIVSAILALLAGAGSYLWRQRIPTAMVAG
jgi:hypothetical protein